MRGHTNQTLERTCVIIESTMNHQTANMRPSASSRVDLCPAAIKQRIYPPHQVPYIFQVLLWLRPCKTTTVDGFLPKAFDIDFLLALQCPFIKNNKKNIINNANNNQNYHHMQMQALPHGVPHLAPMELAMNDEPGRVGQSAFDIVWLMNNV